MPPVSIPNVPILTRPPTTMRKEYVVELCMVSGARHRLVFGFELPTDADGLPDLGKLQGFDPEANAIGNIVGEISKASGDPVLFADRAAALAQRAGAGAKPQRQPVTVPDADGRHIVWRFVESFRYLGELDAVKGPQTPSALRPFSVEG